MVTIGIIGGTGRMGKLFAREFRKSGYKVLCCSRRTKLKPKEVVGRSDVIVFSVPIEATVPAIKKYAPYAKPGSVLTDLTSIKQEPVKAMLKHSGKVVEVVGMHPVFGPGVKSFRGLTFVLTRGRGGKWFAWMKKFLKRKGAKVKVCTPKEHDRMMSVIQGLTHFSTIPLAQTLKKVRVSLDETIGFTSPLFLLRATILGRILSQDPALYADILMGNAQTLKVLEAYTDSLDELKKIIKKKDRKAFIRYFEKSANYLGSFRLKSVKESNRLIDRFLGVSGK